ncbi:MAG: hypothetical protein ACRC2R_14150 [Xenococcaceae cyanobacterium]
MSDDSQRNSAFNAAANSKIYHAKLEDIAQFTPEKINHISRGGIREGLGKTAEQSQQMIDRIPPSQRAGIDGQSAADNVKNYLSDKDASHIVSHKHGGSSHPDNMTWENKSLNRSRGERDMTAPEQINLNVKAGFDNFTGALKAGIEAAPKGAAIGAIATAPLSMLRNGLRVVRGEISATEAAIETTKETAIGGGVGAVSAFTIVTVAAACPPVAVALAAVAPALMVAGGAGMVYEFFKILDEHKQQVKEYYESMTQQQLQYLSQVEDELIYEHEKTLSFFERSQELSEEIINRPREAGVEGALKRYMETSAIAQSLETRSNEYKSIEDSKQNFLITE